MSKFNKDSVGGTLTVVGLLSLVCSLVVAGAAVLLKPTQDLQKQLDKQKNILQAAGLMQPKANVQEIYNKFIEPRIVDLATGEYVEGVTNFDARQAVKDPAQAEAISADQDTARIRVRAKYAEVYLVKNEQGETIQVVVPMHGNGLWSTMYAFVAIQPDGNTVEGLTYYEQAETAGLGGEIANPIWQAQFKGKQLYDEQGNVAIFVGKGGFEANKAHGIDALSGSTLTSNGVNGSLKYWFSQHGFGPFLAKFKEAGAN